jgi:predicted Zn-dependent peptidase
MVLAAVLSAGDSSRLKRRLVREDALATQVLAIAGLTGPFDARDPDIFLVNAVCAAGKRPGEVAQRVLTTVAEVAADGVDPVELRRAVRWLHSTWYREQDSVGGRARRLASYELLYADPQLAIEVPDRLSTVDGEAVRAAAARLSATAPASLHILPKEARR